MTFGSLFAGIGGIDLGFERAGMKCLWQVENNEYCNKVLAKHWPNVRRWNDVRTFPPEPADDWRVDVICGGPPCQPASCAGLRKGEGDERWLWGDAVRIIRHIRPQLAIMENPPALLTLDNGRPFGRILAALDASGFDAAWDCLPASAFSAPFEGDRLFIRAANRERCEVSRWLNVWPQPQPRDWWLSEPSLDRVVNGLSGTVGGGGGNVETAALANAVVPQVAEWIGRRLLDASERR